jgi:hypothetical protein
MPKKNGKSGKKRPGKAQINNRTNFPRTRRLPNRVQASSELWLDMFIHNIDTLLATRDDIALIHVNEMEIIDTAERIANRALDCFQSRWPNAEL